MMLSPSAFLEVDERTPVIEVEPAPMISHFSILWLPCKNSKSKVNSPNQPTLLPDFHRVIATCFVCSDPGLSVPPRKYWKVTSRRKKASFPKVRYILALQIKKQEAMMAQLVEVNKEMQLVCDTLNLKYPPSAEDMANIYGSNTPSIPPEVRLFIMKQPSTRMLMFCREAGRQSVAEPSTRASGQY